METVIRKATKADLDAIHALLESSGLPRPGSEDAPVSFRVAIREGRLVAVAGWEVHRGEALLRSVAVAETERSTGIGSRIVGACLDAIHRSGTAGVTLVTLDAERFFRRFGFTPIAREDVPEPIRGSVEYRIHECAGGQWMRRTPDPASP